MLDLLPRWAWVYLPPVLAVFVMPEDGNYITHIMMYALGTMGAIFGMYELDRSFKEEKRRKEEEKE